MNTIKTNATVTPLDLDAAAEQWASYKKLEAEASAARVAIENQVRSLLPEDLKCGAHQLGPFKLSQGETLSAEEVGAKRLITKFPEWDNSVFKHAIKVDKRTFDKAYASSSAAVKKMLNKVVAHKKGRATFSLVTPKPIIER